MAKIKKHHSAYPHGFSTLHSLVSAVGQSVCYSTLCAINAPRGMLAHEVGSFPNTRARVGAEATRINQIGLEK